MKSFILIDGNAILHRAYHALPPLTNKKGEVANAVYGFFSMFLKIIEDLKPVYVAVCFDRPKPTFRQALFAGYQQHRPAMADDLVPQVGMVHAVLEKMKIAIFEIDGYEADDLIGTLAKQAVHKTIEDRRWKVAVEGRSSKIERKKIHPQSSNFKNLPSTVYHLPSNLEVIIVSGDRDMLQLVNGHVKVLMPVTGLSNTLLYDPKKVEEKYGVTPSQFIDYKALVGDASDGYPGVSGIGPKTASGLIKEFGTFENLYKHVGDLPEKIGLKLATDAEQAALAKKLATIVTDAPVSFDGEKCNFKHFDMGGTRSAFEELGFKSLLKRFVSSMPGEKKKEKIKEKKDNQQLGLL